MNSVNSSLNRQIVWSTTIVAFVALSVMFFGFLIYGYVWDWLYPNQAYPADWSPTDFAVLAINVAIGQTVGAYAGLRLARRLVKPLVAVSEAVRAIAEGDFAARAERQGSFGEADRLIDDFNHMARELQRAEKELSYSNSAIAHELRTPLTILRGRIQGLADGVFEPSREVFIGLAGHVDSLTGIVEDLRILSLMKAGHMEIHVSKFDMAEEVGDIVDSMRPTFAEQRIDVSTDLSRSFVKADRARMRQAILAVLDNVARYAPAAPLRIAVQNSGRYCSLKIADSGPGLTGVECEKAFERFWRADDARNRRSGGSGLGLSVVRAIANAHGGTAAIASREGAGLTITITVPIEAHAR